MRKRSKYRPRPVLANPVAWVLESMTPVAKHGDHLIDLKIKNHGAMTALTQGRATRADMDLLIAMSNMIEALWTFGFGREYTDVMREGREALLEIARRGAATGRFIVRAQEMNALNVFMELHDAQMEAITVGDIERAVALVRREIAAKRATAIVAKGAT
jgi:hypothetical protein